MISLLALLTLIPYAGLFELEEDNFIQIVDSDTGAHYRVKSGVLLLGGDRGNHLKRSVALTKRVNKEMFGVAGQWRFCHDFGKKWIEKGAPTR